ncbi:MAG: hypothetical protein CML46_09185 [Rhodobacteraceae bacterium]|nr:hypothetical protein [Paracoccaceae bacterium]MBR27098.1 hypothetical protein [Paracoccaceae bacterium]
MTSKFILLAAVATSVVALSAQTAAAQCVTSGSDVTCSGLQTGPILVPDDDATVTVNAGASVDGDGEHTFEISGDGVEMTNSGAITSSDGKETVKFTGENLTLRNTATGEITSDDRGIESDGSGAGFTLFNDGEILAPNDDAMRVDEDGVTVFNTGRIEAGGRALRSRGDDFTIVNSGELISNGDEGIEGRDGFDMTNQVGGRVEAFDDGVQFGIGTLRNHGEIIGGDDGIDVDGGLIENTGVIRTSSTAFDAAGIDIDEVDEAGGTPSTLVIDNGDGGVIEGQIGIFADPAAVHAIEIRNAGRIAGLGGEAIHLAPGQMDSLLELSGASEIEGAVIFGGGRDTLLIGDLTTSGHLSNGFEIDGGEGGDLVSFAEGYELSDLYDISLAGDLLTFSFETLSGEDVTAALRSFARLEIGGARYAVRGAGVSAAPAPLAGVLLISGLAGLAGVARRRRAA